MEKLELLKSKVALITGAGRGIGKQIAENFAKNGADLILVSNISKEIEEVAGIAMNYGVKAIALVADVSNYEEVKAVVDESFKTFKRVNILVNNASIITKTPIADLNISDWEKTFNVNFFGALYFCSELIKRMIEKKEGTIINIASRVGLRGIPYFGAYCASKSALIRLADSISYECKKDGIRINTICPARVATKLSTDAFPEEDSSLWISPKEIADTALFLASSLSKAINGEVFKVYGNLYELATYDHHVPEELIGKQFTW